MEANALEVIGREIEEQGPISFARFMELALYDPVHGYYRRGVNVFGSAGDFYTAEDLEPFGELIESVVSSVAQEFAGGIFQVLELGAGRGRLAEQLACWNYQGIDWDNPQLPETVRGVVIANEFLDALPVNLLHKESGQWFEMRVAGTASGLAMTPAAVEHQELREYALRYGGQLEDGAFLEANLHLEDWMRKVYRMLESGYFVILDYGYGERELPRLEGGTLLSYKRHAALDDVLSEPGARDITAHVNFSEAVRLASNCGFAVVKQCSLREWALAIWNQEELTRRLETRSMRWRLQWKQLVFGMGEVFRVLVLKKEGRKEKASELAEA